MLSTVKMKTEPDVCEPFAGALTDVIDLNCALPPVHVVYLLTTAPQGYFITNRSIAPVVLHLFHLQSKCHHFCTPQQMRRSSVWAKQTIANNRPPYMVSVCVSQGLVDSGKDVDLGNQIRLYSIPFVLVRFHYICIVTTLSLLPKPSV